MPLDLISFDATLASNGVRVEWTTENESATSHFVVERTADGTTYTTIGTLDAAGYSMPGDRLHYSLVDGDPVAGTALYRLQSVDLDGTYEYSDLVEVRYTTQTAFALGVYPNPGTGSTLNVSLSGLPAGAAASVHLFDQMGRQVITQNLVTTSARSVAIPLAGRLPAGTYTLRVQHATLGTQTTLVVVQ